jgi:hypothetical protein
VCTEQGCKRARPCDANPNGHEPVLICAVRAGGGGGPASHNGVSVNAPRQCFLSAARPSRRSADRLVRRAAIMTRADGLSSAKHVGRRGSGFSARFHRLHRHGRASLLPRARPDDYMINYFEGKERRRAGAPAKRRPEPERRVPQTPRAREIVGIRSRPHPTPLWAGRSPAALTHLSRHTLHHRYERRAA